MRAGKLRQQITLQTVSLTGDGGGGIASETPVDFATVYADVEPLEGRELFQARQVNDELTHMVTLRYIPGVTSKMSVKYGARNFLIESMIDVDERHREIRLMCKELVA